MHKLLQGTSGKNACMYIALDSLLGRSWDNDGRDFCAGIISENNGYPSQYNYLIPEFAPIKLWEYSFTARYNQPDQYVYLFKDGKRYRLQKDTHILITYSYDLGAKAHATCAPIMLLFEIRMDYTLCIGFNKKTTLIVDRV